MRMFWLSLVIGLSVQATAAEPQALPLAGPWQFALDRKDEGLAGQWWQIDLPEKIALPGALQAQGFGDPVSVETPWTGQIVDRSWFTAPEYAPYRKPGNIKVPFWLQPDRHYVGAAWYRRTIDVPAQWQGKRLLLTLERPHWETRVWLDDLALGSNNSLSTPHVYDLGTQVPPGPHRITVRVDNRLVVDVGINSHSVTDHTQSNWNGVVGQIDVRAVEPAYVAGLQAHPSFAKRTVGVRGAIVADAPGQGKLRVKIGQGPAMVCEKEVAVTWTEKGGTFETELAVESPKAWDEFTPEIYRCTAALDGGTEKTVAFGFRDLGIAGTQFTINGRKTFLRGTLECCIFPKTGHPPCDVPEWKRILGAAKAHGLNTLRFHSWCPPEAAFVAADELGVYLHVECASWANTSTAIGKGLPIDRWLYDEADRILAAYGNHPSFLLLLYGNEPAGNDRQYLAAWVEHYKKKDPRRLYSGGAGWPQIPENQFHVTPDPRVQGWGQGLGSRINARPPETTTDYRAYIAARKVPVVSHEIGQWCVYPNYDEMPKYTGYLKPKNFEIFRDSLAAHGLGGQARQFLLASGKLQTLCYKEEIESALRTPGMAGLELLDLHDFPGQGTALVGVLDPFWEPKGYVTAAEYSRFCNSTVPLARMTKRAWTTAETFVAELEVAHFGPKPLHCGTAWKLTDADGKAVASGTLPARDIPVENGVKLGAVRVPLVQLAAPAKYRLVVGLEETPFENDWDLWVYPDQVAADPSAGVKVVKELSTEALAALKDGGRVLLLVPPGRVKGDARGKVAFGFSSIFWNTAWTNRQPPHTLGILCDPRHPALAQFPTEFHSNYQWWYLVARGQPMILDGLPPLAPIVQVIDDWFTNRRLALAFEAKVGGGRLLVASIDLDKPSDPVSRQFLHSLLNYVGSEKFNPTVELSVAQVNGLMVPPSPLERLGAKVKASSAEADYPAENAIDGDPATLWHTAWTPEVIKPPHEFQIALEKPARLAGLTILPRQDNNVNGRIKEYSCYVSLDGRQWGQPVAEGELDDAPSLKKISFAPVEARHIRLVIRTTARGGPWASIAEIDVVPAE